MPQAGWQTVQVKGRICPSPVATRCSVPMISSTRGRNWVLPGRVMAGVRGRAAGGRQRECEPVMGQSVGHRDKGGSGAKCGATLLGASGESSLKSQNLTDLSNILLSKKEGLKFNTSFFQYIFSFFCFFQISCCSYLWTPALADFLLSPCFVGPPLSSVSWPVLCLHCSDMISMDWPNHSFIWTVTIFQVACKPMLLFFHWAHFKVSQDHTPSLANGPPGIFKHLSDRTMLVCPQTLPSGGCFQHWCFPYFSNFRVQ